jgi:SNF family Na+-dependent transporter
MLFCIQVWIAAAIQVTFSLSVGYGSILSYASFNKFKANYFRLNKDTYISANFSDMLFFFCRDCLIVTACDCFTSVN